LKEEDERTWEERRSRNEVPESVFYEMSPVVLITLKTYSIEESAGEVNGVPVGVLTSVVAGPLTIALQTLLVSVY
jgi:hypothetical protein